MIRDAMSNLSTALESGDRRGRNGFLNYSIYTSNSDKVSKNLG
jgi:hypothetical protein